MISHAIPLYDKHSGQTVEAELIEGITENELRAVESEWKPLIVARLRELHSQGIDVACWPEGWHWDWRSKTQRVQGLLAYQPLSIMCEGRLQGLMLLVQVGYRCRIVEQVNKDLVYVDYLETAPWNRSAIVPTPRFGGVGTVMIRAAVEISREQQLRGRIGLHSLPTAEEFYRNACGMSDLGPDGTKEGLRYFEMTAQQAEAFSK